MYNLIIELMMNTYNLMRRLNNKQYLPLKLN